MWISEFTVDRYTRLMFNDGKKLTIRPTVAQQIILGTNGSGKSSLLRLLCGMPAEQREFTKDGSQTTVLTHNGNNYSLKSWFSNGNKHSFIKNGEELNPGHTITTQKELAYKEFGIDDMIRNLLLGDEKFTTMSPARKRDWFTRMSEVDYTFALKVYSALQSILSEKSGALKHSKKRLVTETAKIISEAEEDKLKQETDIIHRELKLFMEQTVPLDKSVAYYEKLQNDGLEELKRASDRLLRMKLVAPYGTYPYGINRRRAERDDIGELHVQGFESIEEIDGVIDELKSEVVRLTALIAKEVSEHDKVAETVALLTKAGEESIATLKEKLQATQLEIHSQVMKRTFDFTFNEPWPVMFSAFKTMYQDLSDILIRLPENEENHFNSVRLKASEELRDQKRSALLELNNRYVTLTAKHKHAEEHRKHGNQECPKCHHRWIPGFSDLAFNEVVQELKTVGEAIDVETKAIAEVEKTIAELMEYRQIYGEFLRTVRTWPMFEPFWNLLNQTELVRKYPRKAMAHLDALRNDMDIMVGVNDLYAKAKELESAIASLEKAGDADLAQQREKLEKLDEIIGNMTASLAQCQSGLSEHQQHRRQLLDAVELGARIQELKANVEKANADMIETLRRETLNHCVRQLQTNLAIKQETLNAVISQKKIVANLEADVARLTREEEAAKTSLKYLSPTEGLIADGMLGFIRNYVTRMNNWIRKIWTYPLDIECSGTMSESGTELEYKFPFVAKGQPRNDVKEGSAGMQEIFNLAFWVTARHYLHLDSFPLFLDEFGKGFDKAHSQQAIDAVKAIMENHLDAQLFMVSHFESTYGAFPNAEICVLCDDNIMVSGEYNKHVEMN